jgi:TonB family protein
MKNSAAVGCAPISENGLGVTGLALPSQSGKHPAMRSPSLRFKRLALTLVILLNGAVITAPAATKPVTGSHIGRVEHPFVMSNAQWDELFVGTTPGGKRLSAQQLSSLVLHTEWPGNTVHTRGDWYFLKIGVFLLNVRGDGAVSSIEVLQRIGHPQMDGATLRAFAKWRFRPNSVGTVRVPSYWTRIN